MRDSFAFKRLLRESSNMRYLTMLTVFIVFCGRKYLHAVKLNGNLPDSIKFLFELLPNSTSITVVLCMLLSPQINIDRD